MATSTKGYTGRYRLKRNQWSKEKPEESGFNVPRESTAEGRLLQANENVRVDNLYGFHRVTDVKERIGYLINMHATEIVEEDKRLISGVDYYFLEEDCTRFKVSLPYHPYFYVKCRKDTELEVSTFFLKKYHGVISKIETIKKEDLELPNHLSGILQKYLKLSFPNLIDMNKVRVDIRRAVKTNTERDKSHSYYSDLWASTEDHSTETHSKKRIIDHMDNIIDIREFDVPYHIRVSIDLQIFVGCWYSVKTKGTEPPQIIRRPDILETIDPIVLAYDIETTKLPLKFPDATTDQIMMISYMVDGQGFLIINREIISENIDDFEYTPKPEFEGIFKVFNEPNEKATIRKFFDHILELRPHIFVSYNGDFFDWPFVETRAAVHGMDMKESIAFSRNKDDVYASRPSIHMDCLSWVRRDSYLPVGSQGLKAVTKAKLRYDPVEIEPEEMCRLAAEEPKTLANYSVSDAVATYYLYQKYVHPFIFALCTIIPMEPDEVLRKGSGGLCESLLMVEAYKANIIFPNKQETVFNKLTSDGHVLESETYVGGHVEALESGVFRADIPCRFKIIPSAIDDLLNSVEKSLTHAISEEEKIPIDLVTNFNQVVDEIKEKLQALKEQPLRLEKPVIYHLDVGAMYPNIILTNRLQPSAMVNETICAACDFNRPGAKCKKDMEWKWKGEVLSASLGEYQRIQQQLETEKFPPVVPGGQKRPFHHLSKQEQATVEKKRLKDYCKKAYKKTKISKIETKTQTVCQKENSFYVDTVRAFRDRRYEYKGLTKVAKSQVAAAIANNDAGEIRSAKNREILYDSLQLAHKCILNSFYGYVMRRGSRWFSMEMGGIVCLTGAHIIMKAKEIIEQVGRPLELDTDGIWCILPASFPDNFIVHTTHPKKSKLTISYPNAVLNYMVKDEFTNDQYHELVDKESGMYEIRQENSIFFEVDGPYLGMVLPASKEEGKKLKKRYAVFNFDGSLAELKGFEVKRRGELQLIKNFQSSVFECFLKGGTLEECYRAVAEVADYWLDVLYSRGADIPDTELFELISENKSMSKKLEDYGAQKSTSISTAKRLAEFLGDQMVKDAGLACKYIISKKPHGAPVTERAIPLAIFQSEPSVTKHYLRKWLKEPGLQDFDIRQILDWGYYIERLGNTIQKIITIPAAMQGISNPVPRVKHPDWLHKKMMEKNDVKKQRKITDLFSVVERPIIDEIGDIEDTGSQSVFKTPGPVAHKRKRGPESDEGEINKSWKEVLGNPPPFGKSKEERQVWMEFHKRKWAYQAKQKGYQKKKKMRSMENPMEVPRGLIRNTETTTLSGFLRKAQRKLMDTPWHILQVIETNEPGHFRIWALVDKELHQIRLIVPRIFYVNTRKERAEPGPNDLWRKCNKILPRSRPVYNLYQYTVPEDLFQKHSQNLMDSVTHPENEGIYETQMPLMFRVILNVGCICSVDRRTTKSDSDTFHLHQLQLVNTTDSYLRNQNLKHIFLYHNWSSNRQRAMWGLFLGPSKRGHIFILDTVRTNQMPSMSSLYNSERNNALEDPEESKFLSSIPEEMQFDVRMEISQFAINKHIQTALKNYKNEKKGATLLALQSPMDFASLLTDMPGLGEFPVVNTHVQEMENLFGTLQWQKVGAESMVKHYLKLEHILSLMIDQACFFKAPIGNIPADATLFASDVFYARHLQKHNFILWCSTNEKPDFGGSENDDNRLLTDFEESTSCMTNRPGTYSSVSIELGIESLAITTILQAPKVHDIDGTSSSVGFHTGQKATLKDMASDDNPNTVVPTYDEAVSCSASFKILRIMVNGWLRAISLHKNIFADCQVIHFYRWLRTPSALMYDPALRRILYNYMKKLFIQLIAEFKKLGSIIVFANFNKIIICTKKRNIDDGMAYIEHVVGAIKSKELFHSIDISYEHCWEYAMWLDPANFCAIKGKLPERGEEQDDIERDQDDDDEDDTPEISMNWNLAEILPDEGACRASFDTIIAGYISVVHRYMTEVEPGGCTPRPRRRNKTLSQTISGQLGLGSLESTSQFAKQLIAGEMSQKLFQLVQKIQKKIPEKILTSEEHPNLDLQGHDSIKIQPSLEFVKAICKILALDKELEAEVYEMKTNLLRLLGVGAFSEIAEWKDPCISFVLPEIICKACNHTRDVDLCKDSYRHFEEDICSWYCPMCKTDYENEEIEFLLIDALNRKLMAYVLQDLQCKKCGEIKRDNVMELCKCAGEYKTMVGREELSTCVKIMRAIGKKCGMTLLDDTLDETQL